LRTINGLQKKEKNCLKETKNRLRKTISWFPQFKLLNAEDEYHCSDTEQTLNKRDCCIFCLKKKITFYFLFSIEAITFQSSPVVDCDI